MKNQSATPCPSCGAFPWKFLSLSRSSLAAPVDPRWIDNATTIANASLRAATWFRALRPYLIEKPAFRARGQWMVRLIVVAHDGMLPFGTQAAQLFFEALRKALQARTYGRCPLLFTTVLREPIERSISQAVFVVERRLRRYPPWFEA